MKNYRLFSKIIMIFACCLIIATIINLFTGFINATIQIGGSVVCISGCTAAVIWTISLERERKHKRNQTVEDKNPL